jgi:hypothetical protein
LCRNCLRNHVIEGNEKIREIECDRVRSRFGRGYGPVVRLRGDDDDDDDGNYCNKISTVIIMKL